MDAGYRDEVVDSVPPTDGWANRMNKSGIGAVFKILCGA